MVSGIKSLAKLGWKGSWEFVKRMFGNGRWLKQFRDEGGKILLRIVRNTFKDADTWIEAGSVIVKDIKTGIMTGEWDWDGMAFAVGTVFVENYIWNVGGEALNIAGLNMRVTEYELDLEYEMRSEAFGLEDRTPWRANLDDACAQSGLRPDEYLDFASQRMFELSPEQQQVWDVRRRLSSDICDPTGRVNITNDASTTPVFAKCIGPDVYNGIVNDGNIAAFSNCVLRTDDAIMLGNSSDAIDTLGLCFDNTPFTLDGTPNGAPRDEVYMIVGRPSVPNDSAANIYVRASAETPAVTGVDVSSYSAHPDAANQYGLEFDGTGARDPNTGELKYSPQEIANNSVYNAQTRAMLPEVSSITGVPQDEIFYGQGAYFYKATNPSTGTGMTLNQNPNLPSGADRVGVPEFRVSAHGGNYQNRVASGYLAKIDANSSSDRYF